MNWLLTLAHLRSVQVELECKPKELEDDMLSLRLFLEPFLHLHSADVVSDTIWVYPPYSRYGWSRPLECERERKMLLFSELFAEVSVTS